MITMMEKKYQKKGSILRKISWDAILGRKVGGKGMSWDVTSKKKVRQKEEMISWVLA